jgi:hypothetical protein
VLRRTLALLGLLVTSSTLAHGQDPRAAAQTAAAIARARTALAPLMPLVGEWEGEATAMTGPGRTLRIRQHEDVGVGASGTVLIIRGTGRGTEGESAGQVIFEAAAIIWFDAAAGRLRMQTHRDGQSVEPTLELRPDTLVWGFDVPGGRIRYTIAFDKERWHEVGEFIRPGAEPVRTIDLRLARP